MGWVKTVQAALIAWKNTGKTNKKGLSAPNIPKETETGA